ncbi:MAG: nicotinate (nicotinamide) nucleotide adenylyltransferase [Lentisphaeraceae bacterium]|nr:nicotinate (nicotinamide) nucleotide adenylyltransferase [Lentisphaeraceae bacterium]
MNTETNTTNTRNPKQSKRFTAIFGGTFDPVHNAHIALAKDVIAKDLADEVMFVPAAKPPHKLDKAITPAEHRLEMLRLVIEENPDFAVSDYEIINKKKTSYTVNTLRALQAVYPERRFKLIIGMDNFRELDSWYNFQEIINNYELIIFSRPGIIQPSYGQIFEKFGPKATPTLMESIISDISMDVSSTNIRTIIESGDDELSSLVPPEVKRYIEENGLYI